MTPAQRRVLDFVRSFITEKGFPPTRSEIARHFGFRSPNAAEAHLKALEKKGLVGLTRNISRGIRILESSHA